MNLRTQSASQINLRCTSFVGGVDPFLIMTCRSHSEAARVGVLGKHFLLTLYITEIDDETEIDLLVYRSTFCCCDG